MAWLEITHNHYHHFVGFPPSPPDPAVLGLLKQLKEIAMSTQDDVNTLTQELATATATLDINTQTIAGQGSVIAKVGEEIKALQAAVGSAVNLEDAKAAVAAMVTAIAGQAATVQAQGVSLQGLDDLNQDAPTP